MYQEVVSNRVGPSSSPRVTLPFIVVSQLILGVARHVVNFISLIIDLAVHGCSLPGPLPSDVPLFVIELECHDWDQCLHTPCEERCRLS